METDQHEPRTMPRTVLGLLIRADRASVWRSVPMRRGVLVLAVGPGLVAIFGDLPWASMTILPGLVASGGALLFGVNAWCLDGRGALWRENLPVARVGPVRRARLGAHRVPRRRVPDHDRARRAARRDPRRRRSSSALVCTLLVVLLQVVGASMRWSLAHPYPVDLRSARATPAPPAAMVGYSARLATCTTFTEPDLLRRRARARLAAVGAARDPVPAVVGRPPRAHRADAGRTRSRGRSWSPPPLRDPGTKAPVEAAGARTRVGAWTSLPPPGPPT